MSLSFEDSLKKSNMETSIMKSNNILMATAMPTMSMNDIAAPSIMTLDETNGIAAYAGDDGNWQQHPDYVVYNYFSDENLSVINDKKDISLNEKQFNITQEENSQYIPFEMPRYYDGFDLVNTVISIHYETNSGQHGASEPVNVTYNDEKIRFAWLVDAGATIDAGKLKFEIHAYGTITGSDGLSKGYVWKSKRNENLNVLQSLCNCEDVINKIDDSWVQELVTDIAEKIANEIKDVAVGEQVEAAERAADRAESAASSAESAASNAIANALSNYSTTAQMQDYVSTAIAEADIDNKLTSYAKTEDVNTLIGDIGENETVVDYVNSAIASADIDNKLTEYAKTTEVEALIGDIKENETVVDYVDTAIKSVDVTEQLKDYVKTSNLENNYHNKTDVAQLINSTIDEKGFATTSYVEEAIEQADITGKLENYYKKDETYNKSEIDDKVANVQVDLTGYATETYVDNKTTGISSSVESNTKGISDLGVIVGGLQNEISSIDKSPRLTYDIVYNDVENPDVGENGLVLYEITNEGIAGESKSVKSKVIITGGGGGSTAATTLKVERITLSPLTITSSDKAVIEYNVSSVDSDGETVDCSYTWKKGGTIVASGSCNQGKNIFDATEFVSIGTHKFTLTVTDEGGSVSVKTWTIQMVDIRIETSFNDQVKYTANEPINFTYTPYGAIEKTIHFKLDGVELESVTTTASGLLQSYTLPAKAHGAHLLEVWVTAIVNNVEIEPEHIYKDIIWFDETSSIPVIGCIYRCDYYGKVSARQYNATDITYVVYDPNEANATVSRYVDNDNVGTQTLEKSVDVWSYKTADVGEKNLKIECGTTYVDIKLDVAELGITIEPVTANLAFDFNPTGMSNNDKDRVWSDTNTRVTMSVSDNFDWVNGGYQRDDNGDQYFCVKAGTTATFNYNLFGSDYDPKALGKEFKFVFKTTNVKKRSSTFLNCIEKTVAEDGTVTSVGIDMTVENASIYASNKSIFVPYSEEDIIEFEYNINKDADISLLMTYEDGVANRPLIYAPDSSFMQISPKPIVVGSEDCDVHIYRMKAYDTSLTDREILSNFIADARNADEMIARYERNDIYDENGALTPEVLAEKCPDLRIIMIDAPWFTNDKDDKVSGTTVRQIYKGGDPIYDNWTCTGAKHSGQGTSSNKYGYAGRNLRLIMNEDESLFTFNGTDENGNPITGKTVTLGKDSVPNAFWNIKVNIASSENQNNAQFARRYNEFNPFVRAAKAKDPKVKDTMEFYNCVVFVRENESDLTKHREFNDNAWHFYAIGNVGDDKKTDKSRVNDSKDPKECVVEIMDYDVPLAEFPTGIGGDYIAPSEWKAGNTAYDNLYSEYTYDEEGKFKGFGAESYEFRYEMKGLTDEQRQYNIDAWRDFYRFVVTSTDEEFVANFENYFVLDSALYYYLFTERYLMVDNRAKNSFWHRGRVYITQAQLTEMGEEKAKGYIVDDAKAAINDGYRWDLSFFYDADTAIGISNTGQLVLTYGQEDIDKYANGEYIYRAAESNFFCRVRDLFADKLKGVFQSRESLRAWSSSDLIKQWDDAQSQFPEELWRLDIERKYIRTYRGVSIDNSIAGAADPTFLEPMLNGRKKYQRRQFERNNELYFATKYVSTFAKDDFIRMRFTKPEDVIIAPDYTLYLTPYTDMYITAEFGNTAPIVFRAKAGVEYPVARKTDSDSADIVLIYGASFIQAIGDLSKCYLREGNFSKATRLQSLTIGSNANGYKNESLTQLALENNKLLEYLDIRQTTELKTVIDLSKCNNLTELHAEGSGVTGVIFANGGKLEKAYLPAITSLTMKNLQYIDTFDVSNYGNLQQLIVENVPAINTYNIVNSSPLLNTVRLIGINWDESYNIQDTSILDRIMEMRGIDDGGYTIPKSVLTGNFYASVVKEKELLDYINQWKFLTINQSTLVEQFTVTFMNADGSILDVQYVDKGSNAVDPTTRIDNPILPTIESTISHDFEFAGWDSSLNGVFSDRVITATYTESIRSYTIKYVSKGVIMQESIGLYGENIPYTGVTPTYTAEESGYSYYLFNRWDKSGFIDGEKTVNAIFDNFVYTSTAFDGKDLSDLSPVEIYALTKLNESGVVNIQNIITDKDPYTIVVGNDVEYDDIDSELLISEKTYFDGSNKIDTGIQLFDEDKDFVLAIDYEFLSGNKANAVLAQCFQANGTNGFKLWYSAASEFTGAKLTWGTTSNNVVGINKREIIVIRHKKGDNNLTIYKSNLDGDNVLTVDLARTKSTIGTGTLVFGCARADDGIYENYAIGNINWAKVWFADLGEDVCKDLAMWTHEAVALEACGFRKYYLSDNTSKRCSFSLLASHLLGRTKRWNATNTNTGGWAIAELNKSLNTRLYNAMPIQIRQLLKKVIVYSSVGQMSTELSSSDCYITIPSLIEVDPTQTSEPYNSEGISISYLSTNDSRKRAFDGGNYNAYWTRTPNIGYTNYVWRVDENGQTQGITNATTNLGVLIELSF